MHFLNGNMACWQMQSSNRTDLPMKKLTDLKKTFYFPTYFLVLCAFMIWIHALFGPSHITHGKFVSLCIFKSVK